MGTCPRSWLLGVATWGSFSWDLGGVMWPLSLAGGGGGQELGGRHPCACSGDTGEGLCSGNGSSGAVAKAVLCSGPSMWPPTCPSAPATPSLPPEAHSQPWSHDPPLSVKVSASFTPLLGGAFL